MLLYINYHSALMQCTMERGKENQGESQAENGSPKKRWRQYFGQQRTNWLPNGMLTFCARVDSRSGTKAGHFAYMIPQNCFRQKGVSELRNVKDAILLHSVQLTTITYTFFLYLHHSLPFLLIWLPCALCYSYALALYFFVDTIPFTTDCN